jgi:alpha-amylase
MMRRLIFLLIFLMSVTVACSPGGDTVVPTVERVVTAEPTVIVGPTGPPTAEPESTPTPEPTPVTGPFVEGTAGFPWWNDTVFYQVFVRSFYDSNGDGVGDLNGLIEKLDYLNDGDPATTDDLGITGIWLMPIMQSPSYHGYDVVDYYKIDEEYGTSEDFARFMEEAHKRGIRVIVDLVINHTARDHPWFRESQTADSPYRDWYIWSEDDPGYRGPDNQQVWHRTPYGYFYGVFCDCMPDLNFNNPEVTEAIYEISRYWLEDMGVDGFRLDAIKHLIENERLQEFTGATHDWFKDYYTFYKGVNPNAFVVGEAWGPTQQTVKFVGDEVDVVFEFDLADATISSVRNGSKSGVGAAMRRTLDAYPPGQFAAFLRNHDQDRTLSALDGNENKARTAATLLLTSPGVPFIYYGEEIGQQGVRSGNTDENRRLPMQWDDTPNTAGFTTGRPWKAPFNDYPERNVTLQDGDLDSLLNHYRQFIRLRDENEALRVGDFTFVDSNSGSVAAFLRHTDDNVVLVVVNLGARPIEDYRLSLEESALVGPLAAEALVGGGPVVAPELNSAGGFEDYKPVETLEPYANHIIRLR